MLCSQPSAPFTYAGPQCNLSISSIKTCNFANHCRASCLPTSVQKPKGPCVINTKHRAALCGGSGKGTDESQEIWVPSWALPRVCRACFSHEPHLPICKNKQKHTREDGFSGCWQLSVRCVWLNSGCSRPSSPQFEDGGFSRASSAWNAVDPRAFPCPVGAWRAESDPRPHPPAQHPLVAAAGNGTSTLDRSSHPYMPSQACTSPRAPRARVQKRGRRGT